MKELKINEEFKNLIPPLTQEEYRQLEENLIKEGCRDSLVTWNGTIIDGHNRYKICTEHNIKFSITEMGFDTEDDVIEWIIRNQFGRRNLPNYERAKLALRLEPIIKTKAKANQQEHGGTAPGRTLKQKSAEVNRPIETRKEIAKLAGVSHDTIDKVKVIEKEGSKELQEQARKGEISVNKAFRIVRPKKEKEVELKIQTKICKDCGKELPIDEFYENRNDCKDCFNNKRTGSRSEKDFKGNIISISDELKNLSGEEVIGDLYNTEKVIEYNIKFLDEELGSVVDYFIRNSNMCLDMHPELLIDEENIKKIIATLNRAEEAIKKIKRRYANEK